MRLDSGGASGLHHAVWRLLVVVLSGGFNSTAVKFTLVELAPFWSAALRLLLAAAFFVGWMLIRRLQLPRGRALTGSILYGLLNFAAFLGLMYWGLQTTPAGFRDGHPGRRAAADLGVRRGTPPRAVAPEASWIARRAGRHSTDRERAPRQPQRRHSRASSPSAWLRPRWRETNVVVKLFPRPHPMVNNAIGMIGWRGRPVCPRAASPVSR